MDTVGTEKARKEVFDGEENTFPRCRFKKSESQVDLPIVTRPTLDSREGLTRITQRETRRVMVFERMEEKSRSSREVVVLERERELASGSGGNVYI